MIRRLFNTVSALQAAVLLLFLGSVNALAGTMTAELDRSVGYIGEEFLLRLAISGDIESQLSIPEIAGAKAYSAGKSYNTQIINGDMTREVVFSIRIIPSREGDYEIPSIEATIDGEVLRTPPLKFKVKKEYDAQSPDAPARPVFLKRIPSKKKAYIGEAIDLEIELYARVDILGEDVEFGDSSDFREIPDERIGRRRRQVGDKVYDVRTLRRTLVPTVSGTLQLPDFTWLVNVPKARTRRRSRDPFGGFFDEFRRPAKTVRVYAEPIEIEVRSLPEKGKPPGFSGVVGSFNLDTEISDRQVKAGETATVTVSVSGEGLLNQLASPDLALDRSIKNYADKPIGDESFSGAGVRSSKEFKFALVPSRAGTFELGSVKIPVFDPESESYVVLESSLGTLTVEGNSERSMIATAADSDSGAVVQGIGQKGVERLANDLVDVHRRFGGDTRHRLGSADFVHLAAAAGGPLALLLLSWAYAAMRRRGGGDTAKRRRSSAYRRFTTALQSTTEPSEVFRAFRVMVGDKFGVQGAALTDTEILKRIDQPGGELHKRLERLLARMRELEYSPRGLGLDGGADLVSEIKQLAGEVEKSC